MHQGDDDSKASHKNMPGDSGYGLRRSLRLNMSDLRCDCVIGAIVVGGHIMSLNTFHYWWYWQTWKICFLMQLQHYYSHLFLTTGTTGPWQYASVNDGLNGCRLGIGEWKTQKKGVEKRRKQEPPMSLRKVCSVSCWWVMQFQLAVEYSTDIPAGRKIYIILI